MKRRILFVSHSSKFAGAERFLLEVMRGLRDAFDVSLLCPGKGPLVENARREGIITHVIPYFWFLTLRPFFGAQLAFLPANLATFPWIVRLFRKFKFDMIYTNSCVAISGPLAAKWCGIRHLWHVHEAFGQGIYDFGFPFLSQSAIAGMILKLSDAVIANSEYIRKRFPSPVSERVRIVYNGFSPSACFASEEENAAVRRRYGFNADDVILSVVGNLQEMKGQLTAVRAMPSILKKQPNAKLLIMGRYMPGGFFYRKKIESEIAAHRLVDAVRFVEPASDVSSIYQITDVLLVPSLHESFGRTVVEAALYKVPCIASGVGGIPEIIEDGSSGIMILPGDSAALANAVLGLLEDRCKLKSLGEAAFRRIAPRFSMTETVQQITGIVSRVLETGNTPAS